MAETVNFRVGEEFGILLMNIAQEHLIYSYDPIKAINSILESLQGCSMEMALQILKGDIVLLVDVKEQNIIPSNRTEAHDNIFPKIDLLDFMKYHADNVKEHGKAIIDGMLSLQRQIKLDFKYININIGYDDIFKFIAGDNDAILEHLQENTEIGSVKNFLDTTKRFIEEAMKIQSTMKWMINSYGLNNLDYQLYYSYVTETLNDIVYYLNQTLKLEFSMDNVVGDNLQYYLDSIKEIDMVLSEEIKPVDILSNYSAGWLAPNGDFYGLNGDIANMLHNQIANALYEAKIVPEGEANENNPDTWLEQNGWVKIHDNNVQFAGCLNHCFGKKDVMLTEIQINKIYEYISNCWACEISVGWKRERSSIGMFVTMAMNNPEMLNKKYFEF
jgi:signal recognition particle subunit SEC65